MTATPRTGDSRPNGAPAYYLGRPARLWISIAGPRRRRRAPDHQADVPSAPQQ